jgi:hypothetical protein
MIKMHDIFAGEVPLPEVKRAALMKLQSLLGHGRRVDWYIIIDVSEDPSASIFMVYVFLDSIDRKMDSANYVHGVLFQKILFFKFQLVFPRKNTAQKL